MTDKLSFLAGGGEAERMIREKDWTGHPLGPPESWPGSLKVSLSLILNSPESMILAWGPNLHFFFNETYFPLLGPRLDWAMGERFDLVWSDAWAQAKPIIDDALAGRSKRYIDLPWKLDTDRGQADTWWTFSYSRVLDADGSVGGLFIFTNETTARVLADKALTESQEKLRLESERQRLSVQQMPGFVALLAGPEHRFEYVNDAYIAISGQRDFIGRTVRDVFPDIAGQGIYELLDQVYSTGKPFSAKALPISLEGRDAERFLDLLYQPIRDDAGEVVGIFVGGYDITDRVNAERALEQANLTLEDRVAKAMAERSQAEEALRQAQKMDAVGQLTGGLAHDFNNLLAGISGSLELMQLRIGQGRSQDVERYLTAAQGAARRAASLTHRLLAFSRRQTLDPRAVNVNQLVANMAELIARTVGPSVAISVERAADAWTVRVDPHQLENALLNLCINARDAMPSGGRITIRTGNLDIVAGAPSKHGLPRGQYLSLCVTDTGTGMPPEVAARAFEPFFTTKPLGQGTGLGLSMIYGFVQQSGGQASIDSAPGAGTTVRLYLPRHEGPADEDAVETRSSPRPLTAEQGETVLVVDDEPTVRMLVSDTLHELGYTAIEAADGAAGLKVLQSDVRLDLLVTDVGLPGGMNGRQLADAARALRPQLKVLFITGYAETALAVDGQLEPGMSILTKPFVVEQLGERIRDLIAGE